MSRVRRRFWAKVGVSKVAFSPLITKRNQVVKGDAARFPRTGVTTSHDLTELASERYHFPLTSFEQRVYAVT